MEELNRARRLRPFWTLLALLVTRAATLGTDLAQPPVSGRPRAVACPLPWLPAIVAGAPPTTLRRRLSNAFTDKGALQTAVQAYDANSTAAIEKYGPIADWDVSGVTDMSHLFEGLQSFNEDISIAGTRPASRA